MLNQLEQLHLAQRQQDAELEAQIKALEVAFKMQAEATTAFDIGCEPEQVRRRYGSSPFAQSCLLARRLAERGVRYIQVYYVTKNSKQPWDTHKNNDDAHRRLCGDSDQPIAALLTDLKSRGLLDETLVVWGGEFVRTPYTQGVKKKKGETIKPGRDHHHTGFSMWLAGGGVRGGMTYGATDELGMEAVERRVHVHDPHATILHLMGIDHERLIYRYSGRDFRLTDIRGNVVQDIIG